MSAKRRAKPKKKDHRGRCPKTGKCSFPTKQQARTAVARLNKRVAIDLHVYKCQHCRNWHYTKKRTDTPWRFQLPTAHRDDILEQDFSLELTAQLDRLLAPDMNLSPPESLKQST